MRVLLTNRELSNVGGSELVTVELAEEFIRQGHDVTVYCPRARTGPLDTSHLNVVSRVDTSDFDLLWIHHNLLIHELGFRKRDHQRIIFNHMSSWVPDEWPRLPDYEMLLADRILCNSAETRDALQCRGLTGIGLFQNPAPLAFDIPRSDGPPLLISNHPPDELRGVDGIRLGAPNGRPGQMRLSPERLAAARYVVCNGKSCQYSLRAGVPVYLYDSFGGPGWLTPENFERAELFNFSGRGFGRKAAHTILSELETVPPAMPCPDRFRLEKVLGDLL